MKKFIVPRRYNLITKARYSFSDYSEFIFPGIVILTAIIIIITVIANSGSKPTDQSGGYTSGSSGTISEAPITEDPTSTPITEPEPEPQPTSPPAQTLYTVISVVDGDTIKINYNGVTTSVRLIGVNTPETVDPRKDVECFGVEASNYLKNLLAGKQVTIEADPTQSDRDKYDRLLRYVYLDGEDINYKIIANGYGYEYTYNIPYNKQSQYKAAQNDASSNNRGLWAPDACAVAGATPITSTTCDIKGNINSKGEKIYHMPGQRYYDETIITPSKGERWFCSEEEAVSAGWRKAKV